MKLEDIKKRFNLYLDKYWKLSDIEPFLLAYIQLLLLFKNELSQIKLCVLLERQKQLRAKEFKHGDFDEVMNSIRKEIDRNIKENTSTTREAILNRLLFCALLNTEENDFFYLVEPMFEFAQRMLVSPDQLKQILESEFAGFRA